MATKKENPEEKQTLIVRKVCRNCGLLHEESLPIEERGRDEWKMVALAAVGIVLIGLIWFFVFKWGVPLVKYLGNLD